MLKKHTVIGLPVPGKVPPGVGPTGRFPQGKTCPEDEGELTFAIGAADGMVQMQFGTPVAWFSMYPEQGRKVAKAILKHCDQIESETDENAGQAEKLSPH